MIYWEIPYDEKYSEPEIVRDYIAGMTDRYFESTFTDLFLPKKCRYTIDECEKSTLSPRRLV
ncbi:MAG TPA: hypothetical protein C5S50_05460 [Methanosarcinaceae archaeon]|nr:hypothetical protein [Methanosarcinaceae archaeon]